MPRVNVRATFTMFPPDHSCMEGFAVQGLTVTCEPNQFEFPEIAKEDRIRIDSVWGSLTPKANESVREVWSRVLTEAITLSCALAPVFRGWKVTCINFETSSSESIRLLCGFTYDTSFTIREVGQPA